MFDPQLKLTYVINIVTLMYCFLIQVQYSLIPLKTLVHCTV
jgi:hypothetical protein